MLPGSVGIFRAVTLVRMKQSVLSRYRVMAYVTAVWLLVFTAAIILKYAFKVGDTMLISQVHGVLFIIYVIFAFDLGSKAKWPFGKLAWVLLAGTIPTAAFFVERKVSREIAPLIVAESDAEPVRA
jgi:integral membrane protein